MSDKKSNASSRPQKKKNDSKNSKDVPANPHPSKSDFELVDVIRLGGEQDDFELLRNLDAAGELVTDEVSQEDSEESVRNDIRNLLKGFSKAEPSIVKSQRYPSKSPGESPVQSIDKAVVKRLNQKVHVDTKLSVDRSKRQTEPVETKCAELRTSKRKKETPEKQQLPLHTKSAETTAGRGNKPKDVHKVGGMEAKIADPALGRNKKNELMSYHHYDHMLVKAGQSWYQLLEGIPKEESTLSEQELKQAHELAEKLWHNEEELYQARKEADKSSDAQWLRTVLSSGTQSDKVAALAMLTQESPVHQTRSLNSLLSMAGKKSRREALIAIDSLRHLWVSDLLPDRKLRHFNESPVEKLPSLLAEKGKMGLDKVLLVLAFEHELKAAYEKYVSIVENLSKDQLPEIRSKVLGIIYELLSMKPELEQKLLPMLVNKLGDPDRKVAAKAQFLLNKLVTRHPNMKLVVVQEVERVLYRPNISEKAQYYAICFLNQIVLAHNESSLASKLISIYFTFFKVFANKSKSEDKTLSALLVGVNRAFPFTKDIDEKYEEQVNILFRLTHTGSLGTSIQALMLLYQVMESKQSVSDRFYQALYAKLLDPALSISSKHTMLLNLLFKSIKADPAMKRVKSFFKRLLQVCSHEQPSFACGVLFLMAEILKLKPGAKSLTLQPEERDEEERFADVVLDDEGERPLLDSSGASREKNDEPATSDFVEGADRTRDATNKGTGSWAFLGERSDSLSYQIAHRNPLYAGADCSCAWEAVALVNHYHPSVGHFADSVLMGEAIDYKGDPLQDFTLIRFLDRFMYKNPKTKERDHGASIMQPRRESSRLKEEPVNSKQFLQRPEEKIREDELFFYKFFKQKNASNPRLKDKSEKSEGELDDDGSDVENFDFARAMVEGKVSASKKKKRKRKGSDDEDAEDEDEEPTDGKETYDYGNLDDDDMSDEDFDDAASDSKPTDGDYEKALLENLDSEGESIGESDEDVVGESGSKGRRKFDTDSMFAAAEEFADMLEKEDVEDSRMHPKQQAWESRHENRSWKRRKQNGDHKQKWRPQGNRSFTAKRKNFRKR